MCCINRLAKALEETGNGLQEMGTKMKTLGSDIHMTIDGKEEDTE